MTCGIYKIQNKINNKIYYGQSINIEERWKQHIRDKERRQGKLYNAFNKYGIDNFDFKIVEEIKEEDQSLLTERETYYILKDNTIEEGYNIALPINPIGLLNRKLSGEEVEDIRKRKFNKESIEDVYEIYKDKITYGGFMSIWSGRRYSEIAMDNYTEANLKELRSFHKTGEKNGRAILSEQDVRNIRKRKKEGEAFRFVYADYANKISYGGMRSIWRGDSWKNIN